MFSKDKPCVGTILEVLTEGQHFTPTSGLSRRTFLFTSTLQDFLQERHKQMKGNQEGNFVGDKDAQSRGLLDL